MRDTLLVAVRTFRAHANAMQWLRRWFELTLSAGFESSFLCIVRPCV
jgi:hypothetical protein